MNRRISFICFLLICTAIMAMQVDRVNKREKIVGDWTLTLPSKSGVIVGVSMKSPSVYIRQTNARDLAAVMYSRMNSAYSVDKLITMTYSGQDFVDENCAKVQYTVTADTAFTRAVFDSLKIVYEQEIPGYYIALMSLTPVKKIGGFEQSPIDSTEITAPIIIGKKEILCYGESRSSKLDIAYEEALNYAMLEYGKYLSKKVRVMDKSRNENTSQVINTEAMNKVNNIEISKMLIRVISDNGLYSYKVQTELRCLK